MIRALHTWIYVALALLLAVFVALALPLASWAGEQGNPPSDVTAEPAIAAENGGSDEGAAGASGAPVVGKAAEPAAETPAPATEVATPAAEPAAETPAPAAEPAAETPAPAAEPAAETPAPAAEPAEAPAPAPEPAAPAATPVQPSEATPSDASPAPASQSAQSTSLPQVDQQVAAQEAETPVAVSKPASAAPVSKPFRAAKKASGKNATAKSAKNPLADGTYLLAWAKSPKFIVQSAKNSRKAGANVLLAKKNSTPLRQRWVVRYVASVGAYTIVNEYAKKALAVVAGKKGANVLQVKKQDGDEKQLWSLEKVGRCYVFSPVANPKLALTGEKQKGCYDLVLRAAQRVKTQRLFAFDEGIVEDGIYSIAPTNNAKKAVTVPKNYVKGKTTPWLYSYEGDLRQKYQLVYQGGNEYTVQSAHSGRNLSVSGSTVVQHISQAAKKNQRWIITWNKTGLGFRNVATGERLVAPDPSAKGKPRLKTAKAANNESQRFTLKSRHLVDNGVYIIQAFEQDLALAVQDGSMAENGNIDVEKTSKANAQKFRITYLKGGRYRITSMKSGLTVGYVSGNSGANVQQRSDNGSPSQLFTAEVAPNGGIKFVGVNGGMVLGVAGDTATSGANARMEKFNGGKDQRWWLLRTQENPDEDVVGRAMKKALSKGSATNWYIAVDLTKHRTIVLKRSGSSWKLSANWLCSVGAPETPTVLGDYTVGIKGYSFGEGFTCYYYTQFWGDYLIHSVKYYQDTFNVKDGRLGQDVSEGCVRLPLNQAKWIYNNIPEGTRVSTYK